MKNHFYLIPCFLLLVIFATLGYAKDNLKLYPFKANKEYGFIDSYGRIAVASQFTKAKDFSDGLAAIQIKDVWGFVDTKGSIIINPQFSEAESFHEGLACIREKSTSGKYGYIDKNGKTVIEPQYTKATIMPKKNTMVMVPTIIDEGER